MSPLFTRGARGLALSADHHVLAAIVQAHRPPKHTPFKKTQFGNPRGGSRDKRLDLQEVLRRNLAQ